MHPLSIMGLLATLGGLVAAAVALFRLHAAGNPLAPVLVEAGIPLALLTLGVVASTRLQQRRGLGAPLLLASFFAAALAWWVLTRR